LSMPATGLRQMLLTQTVRMLFIRRQRVS
jgi:hypothetical protein